MSTLVDALGSTPISAAVMGATRRRLRAIAYHQVADVDVFEQHLNFLADHFTSVTGQQVADALSGLAPMPQRPLWITFDDGDRSVIERALPMLRDRGMVATAFLCGAWVDSTEAPWWRVVEAAHAADVIRDSDLGPRDLMAFRLALKGCSDPARRRVVDELAARLEEIGSPVSCPQWSAADVRSWVAAGNDVGNHSWDHPCLDRCDEWEQRAVRSGRPTCGWVLSSVVRSMLPRGQTGILPLQLSTNSRRSAIG